MHPLLQAYRETEPLPRSLRAGLQVRCQHTARRSLRPSGWYSSDRLWAEGRWAGHAHKADVSQWDPISHVSSIIFCLDVDQPDTRQSHRLVSSPSRHVGVKETSVTRMPSGCSSAKHCRVRKGRQPRAPSRRKVDGGIKKLLEGLSCFLRFSCHLSFMLWSVPLKS